MNEPVKIEATRNIEAAKFPVSLTTDDRRPSMPYGGNEYSESKRNLLIKKDASFSAPGSVLENNRNSNPYSETPVVDILSAASPERLKDHSIGPSRQAHP